jgi:KTSC domain
MNLAGIPSVAVQSSLLASVSYDPGESILLLEFCDGAVYQYFDVPAEIHNNLLAAESKGSYFNRRIRDYFQHKLLRRKG